MLVCSCTMAGTAACRNCPEYIKEFGLPTIDYYYVDWSTFQPIINSFDSDRYELVEKKDWKINQLKANIEIFKEDIRYNEEELKKLFELKTKLYDALTIAREELRELEK